MKGILGADVFINLLLVFIITTGLLLMNTNKSGAPAGEASRESHMPKVALPGSDSPRATEGISGKTAAVTGRMSGGKIELFLDDAPVKVDSLAEALKSIGASSVRMRLDREISYGQYVALLDIVKQAGVAEIYNIYTTEGGR